MLEDVRQAGIEVKQVGADGTYNTFEVYQSLLQAQIEPIIPPRENTAFWVDKEDLLLDHQGMWKLSSRTANRQNVQFRYDTEGQLRSVINEKRETYRFELSSEGEEIEETGFDGLTRKYQRNKAGQVEKLLRNDGKATAYEYDACSRIVEVQYSDGKWESYA